MFFTLEIKMNIQMTFNYSKITSVILITPYLNVNIHFPIFYAPNIYQVTNYTQKCI